MSDANEHNNELALWLSGDLDEERSQELESSEDIKDLKFVLADLDQWSLPPFDTDAKLKLLKQQRSQATSGPKLIRMRHLLQYAAALLILVSLYFGLRNTAIFNPETTVMAPIGEPLQHYLPDSSLVVIAPSSSISYRKNYLKSRDLELEGQAYFEVKDGNPFVVSSNHGTTEVLGTRFDIRDLAESYIVKCYSGKVVVEVEDQNLVLTKGEGAIYTDDKFRTYTLERDGPGWTNHNYYYNAVSLKEVITDINRYHGTSIVLPERYGSLVFTGILEQQQGLDKVLSDLFGTMGIAYSRNADNTITFE